MSWIANDTFACLPYKRLKEKYIERSDYINSVHKNNAADVQLHQSVVLASETYIVSYNGSSKVMKLGVNGVSGSFVAQIALSSWCFCHRWWYHTRSQFARPFYSEIKRQWQAFFLIASLDVPKKAPLYWFIQCLVCRVGSSSRFHTFGFIVNDDKSVKMGIDVQNRHEQIVYAACHLWKQSVRVRTFYLFSLTDRGCFTVPHKE